MRFNEFDHQVCALTSCARRHAPATPPLAESIHQGGGGGFKEEERTSDLPETQKKIKVHLIRGRIK